ncbi:hypothetical protein SAMN05216321_101144 [Cupriavidus sp. OV038]|jgi:hypothetical protein|nr:hypothetical protein SAMN05216321_101144 [Cupriavidus sp. OV038]SFO58351.1 hypothetical protein SAMN05216322_101144 [Cupriavidus sp. OV096]
MGEIADMMLDGTLCEGCGCTNRKGGDGPPWRCGRCKDDAPPVTPERQTSPSNRLAKVPCATCGRRVKRVGLDDHVRDTHASGETQ